MFRLCSQTTMNVLMTLSILSTDIYKLQGSHRKEESRIPTNMILSLCPLLLINSSSRPLPIIIQLPDRFTTVTDAFTQMSFMFSRPLRAKTKKFIKIRLIIWKQRITEYMDLLLILWFKYKWTSRRFFHLTWCRRNVACLKISDIIQNALSIL